MSKLRIFIGNLLILLGVAFVADMELWWKAIPMLMLLVGLEIRFGDNNG